MRQMMGVAVGNGGANVPIGLYVKQISAVFRLQISATHLLCTLCRTEATYDMATQFFAQFTLSHVRMLHNDDGKWCKCVCTTTNQPDTNSDPNRNPATKNTARNSQHSTKYSHIPYVSR